MGDWDSADIHDARNRIADLEAKIELLTASVEYTVEVFEELEELEYPQHPAHIIAMFRLSEALKCRDWRKRW